MRIAGIDHEVSTLELVWAQAEEEERALLAAGLMKRYYDAAGQKIKMKTETDDGTYLITVEKL